MRHTLTLLTLFFLGTITVSPVSAQDQTEERRGIGSGGGRGPGFGNGRGPGFGRGRGMRIHATANEKQVSSNEVQYPVILDHGGVVRLPDAAQQPRASTKLLVDLTSGGDADKLNAGLDKVAKYLNIYAGAGAEPAELKIAVVLHGEATLTVLNSDAYAAKFNTDGNPNLKLLRQLHDSNVELYVCGQSLIAKGSAPHDVAPFIKTAVSALTAVVNLQSDGFAYVPIAHTPTVPTAGQHSMAANQPSNAGDENADHKPHSGAGRGPGPGAMQGMQGDMTTLHAMFADREKILRTVKMLADGAEAVTESEDELIASMIKEHVPAMEERVLGNKPLPPMTFHPIFVELIKHANDYTLTYEETDKGMKVRYQSDDPYVVMLVQEHAKLVSRFIKNGMEEIHTPYELPARQERSDVDGR